MTAASGEGLFERRWLRLFVSTRLASAAIAAGLVALRPFTDTDPLLGVLAVAWALLTVAVVRLAPRAARVRSAWVLDAGVCIALVVAGGEWRSPFYLLAVTSLVLPATALSMRGALAAGGVFATVYGTAALATGIDWDALGSTARLGSFSTYLLVPLLVAFALAFAQRLLEELAAERERAEALALEAERRRIGWELHDSAKQRIHAAHLVLTSVAAAETGGGDGPIGLAVAELEAATVDMEASLTELRTTLGGQRLEEAVARRAAELEAASGVPIRVRGSAPSLPTHVAVHAYRVASEAMSNAVRHARATAVAVDLSAEDGHLVVAISDDGRGLPAGRREGAAGLDSMEARAEALGGRLAVGRGSGGRGTRVTLDVPLAGRTLPAG